MQLFQTLKVLKKIINQTSLIIFIFFISCAVRAEDKSIIINEKKTEVVEEKKAEVVEEKKETKKPNPEIVKPSKSVKSSAKSKNKSSKKTKTKKIIRKKIIKKIYVEKTPQANEKAENIVEIKKEEPKILPVIEKPSEDDIEISSEYYIQSELKDNCDKLTAGECFRADKFFGEAYHHYSLLTIFDNKAVIEQYYEGNGKNKDFIKVANGDFLINSKKNNKIFISIKNGIVAELFLLKGDLSIEEKVESDCQITDKLLAFYRLYKPNEYKEMSVFVKNPENFKGLVETIIFTPKYQPNIFYANIQQDKEANKIINNLNICKIGDELEGLSRDFTKSQCNRKFRCTMENLEKYGSEGFMTKDREFPYYEFYRYNKIISLNKNQIDGLMGEVAKLSREDKELLKRECFDDKNIDLMSCAKSEKCDDYLVVENCEVKYFFDNDKLKFSK